MHILSTFALLVLALGDAEISAMKQKMPSKKSDAIQMGRLFAILEKEDRNSLYDEKIANLRLFKDPNFGNRCAAALFRRYYKDDLKNNQAKLNFLKEKLPIFKDGHEARKKACEHYSWSITGSTRKFYQAFLANVLGCDASDESESSEVMSAPPSSPITPYNSIVLEFNHELEHELSELEKRYAKELTFSITMNI